MKVSMTMKENGFSAAIEVQTDLLRGWCRYDQDRLEKAVMNHHPAADDPWIVEVGGLWGDDTKAEVQLEYYYREKKLYVNVRHGNSKVCQSEALRMIHDSARDRFMGWLLEAAKASLHAKMIKSMEEKEEVKI